METHVASLTDKLPRSISLPDRTDPIPKVEVACFTFTQKCGGVGIPNSFYTYTHAQNSGSNLSCVFPLLRDPIWMRRLMFMLGFLRYRISSPR